MATEDLVRKLEDALNRHDPATLAQLYAPDCTAYDPFYPQPLKGRDAIKEDYANFVKAFPDLRMQVQNVFTKGDMACTEAVLSGTHRGGLASPNGEIPPTNKRIELNGAMSCRMNQQGQITEERRYYDTGALLQQLGLMPELQMAGQQTGARRR